MLTSEDLADFSRAEWKVYMLMEDEMWHDSKDILAAAEYQWEGLRRMRELRKHPTVAGIVKRRMAGVRRWEYRMILKPKYHKVFP